MNSINQREKIKVQVVEIIKEIIEDQNIEIDCQEDLREYGIDSTLFIKIVINIEMKLEIELDNDYLDYSYIENTNDLLECVYKQVL